jgi:site-specific recombinase XerD
MTLSHTGTGGGHERYLEQDNIHFAVIPDEPQPRELRAPQQRLLSSRNRDYDRQVTRTVIRSLKMQINSFIEHMRARGCSRKTLRAYRQDLQRFETFLKDRKIKSHQVNTSHVDQFVMYLAQTVSRMVGSVPKPASVSRRLAVLSRYYRFMQQMTFGKAHNPLTGYERPKFDNEEYRAVDEGQLSTLIAGIDNVRDRAIIVLFLYSGLRLAKLCSLDVNTIKIRDKVTAKGHIRLGRGEVTGKGSKVRTFVVDESAMKMVADYLMTRINDRKAALFLSSRGGRLSSRAIQRILQKWCVRLEMSHINIHRLRHCYADRLANAGISSIVLQSLMGHSSPQVTRRYYKIKADRISREYFAASEFIEAPAR